MSLSGHFEKVVINGHSSPWTKVNGGVPEGLLLGHPLFLIYMKALSDGLHSNQKHFADDPSPISILQDIITCTVWLNLDLAKISEGVVQWKMNFNSNFCKQVEELLFGRKICSNPYPYSSHRVSMKTHSPSSISKELRVAVISKIKFWYTYSMYLK